ncbi:MAG: BtpA/SgcQ family protein, partial [Pseudomonadota bacterium]
MGSNFQNVFGSGKPVIAMVHLGALPGTPLYDAARGVDGILADAAADLDALEAAGVDAVLFGNENDRPYEFQVDPASTATMA